MLRYLKKLFLAFIGIHVFGLAFGALLEVALPALDAYAVSIEAQSHKSSIVAYYDQTRNSEPFYWPQ